MQSPFGVADVEPIDQAVQFSSKVHVQHGNYVLGRINATARHDLHRNDLRPTNRTVVDDAHDYVVGTRSARRLKALPDQDAGTDQHRGGDR